MIVQTRTKQYVLRNGKQIYQNTVQSTKGGYGALSTICCSMGALTHLSKTLRNIMYYPCNKQFHHQVKGTRPIQNVERKVNIWWKTKIEKKLGKNDYMYLSCRKRVITSKGPNIPQKDNQPFL